MLKTDYQNYIPAENMGGRKRYQLVNNDDGTVSLIDTTEYAIVGNKFGATDINNTNERVNNLYGYITSQTILDKSLWVNGVYTLQSSNFTGSNMVYIIPGYSLTTAQIEAMQEALIFLNRVSVGEIKLKAYGTVPTIDIPIIIYIKRDGVF